VFATLEKIVIDRENKVVTTPAFLALQNMNEIKSGIDKMVRELNVCNFLWYNWTILGQPMKT